MEPPLLVPVAVLPDSVLVLEPIELAPDEPMVGEPMALELEPVEPLELPMVLLSVLEDVEGDGELVEGLLMGAGVAAGMVLVSSAFFPQAPSARSAARATAVAAAGLSRDANITVFLFELEKMDWRTESQISQISIYRRPRFSP